MLKRLPPVAIDKETPGRQAWDRRAPLLRRRLRHLLGFPPGYTPDLHVWWEVRESIAGDGYRIEKIVYESETNPTSRVTASLYIPEWPAERGLASDRLPAMILACGHGGSKSSLYNQYACQLYAQLGCIVLMPDPIGEEERHPTAGMGLRGHREETYLDRAMNVGRPIVGKMVFDLVRGIDLLRSHPQVDSERIGCAGSSLGGTVTQYLAAVEERLAVCINSAWAADYRLLDGAKGCCFRLPGLMQEVNQAEMIALAAPHCAYLVMTGLIDEVCPPAGAQEMVAAARRVYGLYGDPERCRLVLNPETGHQPYHISPTGVEWLQEHLGVTPAWEAGAPAGVGAESQTQDGKGVPAIVTLGEMAARHGTTIEKLYNVERHHKGAIVYDVNLVRREPAELRVLADAERLEGPYTLPRWLDDLERAELAETPGPGVSDQALATWLDGMEARRDELRALLGAELFAVSWMPGESIPLDRLGLMPEDAAKTRLPVGTKAWVHALHFGVMPGLGNWVETDVESGSGAVAHGQLPGVFALSLRAAEPARTNAARHADQRPRAAQAAHAAQTAQAGRADQAAQAAQAGRADQAETVSAVIYLPQSRDWRMSDWGQVGEWLEAGSAVMILSGAQLYDDELLVGTSATAFNVAMTLAAVERLSSEGAHRSIACYGEVDDVAAWAAALDERIRRLYVRSRGGVEPSSMGTKRREGVVPRVRRIVDQVGMWALTLPRKVEIASSVATPAELEQLAWLREQIVRWQADHMSDDSDRQTS